MTREMVLKAILTMSPEERLQLVEEIWDSLQEHPEVLGLSEEDEQDLLQRAQKVEADPHRGSPWAEVKERIRKRAARR